MIQKKICLLGAFAVGKTSLVERFVKSLYSDQYLTTVGVKVDKKPIRLGDEEINLMIWDLAGEDEFQKVRMEFLRGTAGYLLVADGTRQNTVETARLLEQRVAQTIGSLPFVFLLNKADLVNEWEIDERIMEELRAQGWDVLKSSAKTGESVEEAFQLLAQKLFL